MAEPPLDARVSALRHAGRYEEASDELIRAERPTEASNLLAAVWKYDRAIAKLGIDPVLLSSAAGHA